MPSPQCSCAFNNVLPAIVFETAGDRPHELIWAGHDAGVFDPSRTDYKGRFFTLRMSLPRSLNSTVGEVEDLLDYRVDKRLKILFIASGNAYVLRMSCEIAEGAQMLASWWRIQPVPTPLSVKIVSLLGFY